MNKDNLPPLPDPDGRLSARPSRARYDKVRHELERKWRRRSDMRHDRMMKEIIDELWDSFENAPYSWCGFYVLGPAGDQLVLGAHRDKPASSPRALDGACGRALKDGKTQIEGGPLSEIAVPVFDQKGKTWAVLDVCSAAKDAFDQMDQRWLETIVKAFAELDRPEPGR